MPPFRLTLLGGFILARPDGTPVRVSARKARALLAYTALRPNLPHSRDKLATLLWEDVGEVQARASLRQTLSVLRHSLEGLDACLEATPDTLAFRPPVEAVDVACFERALAEGTPAALQRAVALYAGDLLDGFNIQAPGFDEWLVTERQHLRERALNGLAHLLDHHLAAGDSGAALGCALRLVALDPLREPARRAIMTLYARTGRQALALRHYREFRDLLQQELGVPPEPETEALYRDIRHQRHQGRPGSPARAPERPAPDVPPPPPAVTDEVEPVPAPISDPSPSPSRSVIAEPCTPGAPGHAAAPTELREVAILVAELAEFEQLAARRDPEELHHLVADYHRCAERVVAAFGGSVERRAAGVLAVFGVPVAHGNDAERAVSAALRLHAELAAAPVALPGARPSGLAARIGIACGQILVDAGPNARPAPSLTGAAVRQAERLAAAAGGGHILATPEIRAALGERLDGSAVDPAHPESAWRVAALRPAADPARRPPFVGRGTELNQFRALITACREAGEGAIVCVRGDPGIGKSRLVETFRDIAAPAGFHGHIGFFLDFGMERQGDAIASIVRSLLGAAPEADAPTLDRSIEQAIAAGLIEPDDRILLASLLDLPQAPELRALYTAMDEATRSAGRCAALARLLRGRSHQAPQLVVLEDVHWADPPSLETVAALAEQVPDCPVVFVLTTRAEQDPITRAWRAAFRSMHLVTLDLGPLRLAEEQALAEAFPVEAGFRIRCIARAAGNPLFLEQLLRAGEAADPEVPGSVRSVVLARLDRLEARDRAALQAASVLGQRFTLPALRHLIDDPLYQGTALIAQALIRREPGTLVFDHALVAEAVYGSLLKSRHRQLHRRAAAWFEGRDVVLWAQHLDRAEAPEAPAACLAAAGALAAQHDPEQALRLADRALALASDPADRVRATLQRASLLHDLGRIDESRSACEQALAMAGSAYPHGQARALLGIAAALRLTDRLDAALDALNRAEALAGSHDGLRAEIHLGRANICFPLGRIDACLAEHERALERARRSGSVELEAHALGGLGDGYYAAGRMATALAHFEQCVARARAHNFARIEAAHLYMVAAAKFFDGRLSEALADAEAGAALASRIGHLRAELLSCIVAANILLENGDFTRVEALLARAWPLMGRIGSRRFQAEVLTSAGHIRRLRGDRAGALDRLKEALAVCRETGMGYLGPQVLAEIALTVDDPAERDRALGEGEALLAAGAVGHNHLLFFRDAIQLMLDARDWGRAEHYAEALEAYIGTEPIGWAQFYIARGRALAAHGRGRRDAALRAELERLRAVAGMRGFTQARSGLEQALHAF